MNAGWGRLILLPVVGTLTAFMLANKPASAEERTYADVLTGNEEKIPVSLPGGTEIRVTLESLTGSEDDPTHAALRNFTLLLQTNEGNETELTPVSGTRDVRSTDLPVTLRHTTSGKSDNNRYYVLMKRWYGGTVSYQFRVETIPRYDLGTGQDAGNRGDAERALDLAVGESVEGYLFGAPEVKGEDYEDFFRIPNVPGGMEVKVTLESMKGSDENPSRAGIYYFELFLETVNEAGETELTPLHRPYELTPDDLPYTLRHTTSGANADNTYYVSLQHWYGYVSYQLRAETIPRYDLVTARDAGNRGDTERALDLPVGKTMNAHLFGESAHKHEDYEDLFRVPNVPGGRELRVTMESLSGRIADFYLLLPMANEAGETDLVAVDNHYDLTGDDLPVTLRHTTSGEESDRIYYVLVENWVGDTSYSLKVDIIEKFRVEVISADDPDPLRARPLDTIAIGESFRARVTFQEPPEAQHDQISLTVTSPMGEVEAEATRESDNVFLTSPISVAAPVGQ